MANEKERKLAADAKKWETVSKLWVPSTSLPGVSKRQGSSQTVQILNEREFIVVTDDDQIFKYNTHRDEWSLFLKLPETELDISEFGESNSHKLDLAIAIDQRTNRLFVAAKCAKGNKDTVLDIETGSIVDCSTLEQKWLPKVGRIVNADGVIHKLCGTDWGCMSMQYGMRWSRNGITTKSINTWRLFMTN